VTKVAYYAAAVFTGLNWHIIEIAHPGALKQSQITPRCQKKDTTSLKNEKEKWLLMGLEPATSHSTVWRPTCYNACFLEYSGIRVHKDLIYLLSTLEAFLELKVYLGGMRGVKFLYVDKSALQFSNYLGGIFGAKSAPWSRLWRHILPCDYVCIAVQLLSWRHFWN